MEIHDVNNEVAELTQSLRAFNSSAKVSRKKNPREIYSPGLIRIMQSRKRRRPTRRNYVPDVRSRDALRPAINIRSPGGYLITRLLARFLISINPSSIGLSERPNRVQSAGNRRATERNRETEESRRIGESDAVNRRVRGSANVNRSRLSRDDVSIRYGLKRARRENGKATPFFRRASHRQVKGKSMILKRTGIER